MLVTRRHRSGFFFLDSISVFATATLPTMDPKERFYRQFQLNTKNLQDQISQLHTLSAVAGERQDAHEHVLAGISRLSQEVADAADYVPAYDQRTYSQTIKGLTDQLKAETAKFTPKNRFQFRPRAAQTTTDNDTTTTTTTDLKPQDSRHLAVNLNHNDASHSAETSEARDTVGSLPTAIPAAGKNYNDEIRARPTLGMGVRKPSFSAARDITLSNHSKIHIILPSSASRATSSGALTDLAGCIVDMSVPTAAQGGAFANLVLKNISRSLIVAGHVDGSVHVSGVADSVLVLVAHQVRLHDCRNVTLYVHCTGRPIIEDCEGMRFASAPKCYLAEGDATKTNRFADVDDFKWLKAQQSPNWKVLAEEDRLPEDIWTKTVPGGPGVGVDDILKKVGVIQT